jgi:RNA recognition motif-containing protein
LESHSIADSVASHSTAHSNKEYVILYDQEYSGIRKRNTPDVEKQKYVISVEKIVNNLDLRTTLMVKNIPNTISQVQLLEQFNINHKGSFNFFYLPIDFKTKLNVGYAFINFKEPSKIVNFFLEFNCKKWQLGNESKRDKVCFLSYARIQGLRCILDHFKRSSIMKQIDEKLKPMVFN